MLITFQFFFSFFLVGLLKAIAPEVGKAAEAYVWTVRAASFFWRLCVLGCFDVVDCCHDNVLRHSSRLIGEDALGREQLLRAATAAISRVAAWRLR